MRRGKVVFLDPLEEESGTGFDMRTNVARERGMSVAIVDPDFERGNAVSAIVCTMRPNGVTPRITRLRDVENPQALRNQGIDVVLIALDGDKEQAQQAIETICNLGGFSPSSMGNAPTENC